LIASGTPHWANLAKRFQSEGFCVQVANGPDDALRRLTSDSPDVVIASARCWSGASHEIFEQVHAEARTSMLVVPDHGLSSALIRGLHASLGPVDLASRRAAGEQPGVVDRLLGRSRACRELHTRIEAVAELCVPVLFCGEPGTGRSDAARRLQVLSGMADVPFVRFEPVRGRRLHAIDEPSFVFIDEVHTLSPEDQKGCLLWLKSAKSDVAVPRRICASTSEDLLELADRGAFLPELADRLDRFSIRIAPLRERDEDLLVLVPAWLDALSARLGCPSVEIEPSALEQLRNHDWKRNAADLVEALEKLVAFSAGRPIDAPQVGRVLSERTRGVESIRMQRHRREREELVELLDRCGGNLAAVARELDLSRGAVIYRAKKYGLMGDRA
jgi:DNA-binding NtrC family response regulator